jgi:hypothetical protein
VLAAYAPLAGGMIFGGVIGWAACEIFGIERHRHRWEREQAQRGADEAQQTRDPIVPLIQSHHV